MASEAQDFLLRSIERTAAALDRIREHMRPDGPAVTPQDLIKEIRMAQADLLGPLWTTLRSLDPTTASALVPDKRQRELLSQLLHLEAQAHLDLGDESTAATLASRADIYGKTR